MIRNTLVKSSGTMVKVGAALAAGLAVSAGTALAGPVNLKHVPADATSIIHIDVEAAVGSTIGRFIIENGDEMGIEQLQEIEEIEAEIGLNPLEDVYGVTVILSGEDIDVIIVSTNSTVEDALEAIQDKVGETFETTRIGGHEMIAVRDEGEPMFIWVESSGRKRTVIAGRDAKRVAQVVSLTEGEGKSLKGSDSPLASAKPVDGAILFIASLDADNFGKNSPASAILGEASAVVVQAGEDDGEAFVQASLDIGEKNAQNVAKMAAGLVAMRQLAAQYEDQDDARKAAVIELLTAIEFESDDGNVEASFRYDIEKLLGLLQSAHRNYK